VAVETLAPLLNSLNEQLTTLHAALPAHTALILFTGHDDPLRMAYLNARKGVFERAIKSGKNLEEVPKELWWSAQEGRDLEDAVEEAKRGLFFIAMKTAGVGW
jgi:RNA exonuclease 1